MSDFKKHVLRSGIIIVVMLVLFGGFIFLFHANIAHQLVFIQELSTQRNLYLQSSQGLAVLTKDWNTAQLYKNQVQMLIPKKDDIVLLSKELQARALKKNISLTFSFNAAGEVETGSDKSKVGSIGFSSTLEGNNQDILTFLDEIERSYYALQIQSFDLMAGVGNNTSLSRFFVTGKVFFHE
jgi:hypothetical protein